MAGLTCCSLVETPLLHPIILGALSVPKDRQLSKGTFLLSSSCFRQSKIFSPEEYNHILFNNSLVLGIIENMVKLNS